MSKVPAKPVSIGRAGLEPALLALSEVEFDGVSGVELGGTIRGARSLAELVAVRDQVRGLEGNRDEPVVPVVCAGDPSLDGFYRVSGSRVGSDPTMRLSTGSVLPWSVSLERVAGSASPVFDTRLLHAVRSGSAVTPASSDPLHGVPPTTTVYRRGSNGLGSLVERSIADGGSVYVSVWAGNDSQANAEWQAAPDGVYRGSASVLRVDGGTGYPIVGKDVDGDLDPNRGWSLSNGLVSVRPSEGLGGTAGCITVLSWAGSGFESANVLSFTVAASTLDSFAAVSILRNSPEATTVRLQAERQDGRTFASIDITIRRGDRTVQDVLRPSASSAMSVNNTTTALGTAITGSVRVTSNDADGNRAVMTTAVGTLSTVSNPISHTGTVLDFGFGVEIGGSGASGIETAQSLANQYAAYVSERVTAANP